MTRKNIATDQSACPCRLLTANLFTCPTLDRYRLCVLISVSESPRSTPTWRSNACARLSSGAATQCRHRKHCVTTRSIPRVWAQQSWIAGWQHKQKKLSFVGSQGCKLPVAVAEALRETMAWFGPAERGGTCSAHSLFRACGIRFLQTQNVRWIPFGTSVVIVWA